MPEFKRRFIGRLFPSVRDFVVCVHLPNRRGQPLSGLTVETLP